MWCAVDASDRRLFLVPRHIRFLVADVRAALANGVKNVVTEFFRLSRPWGLPLEQISIPVRWWHGLADRYVPWKFAEYTAKRIPTVDIRKIYGAGHFMVFERAASFLRPLNLPRVTLLFGLAGAGKTYVGSKLGALTGVYVYEADDELTPEMLACLARGELFTSDMRTEYFKRVAERILKLLATKQHLIVTQSAYSAEHRAMLEREIPGLEPIWVVASWPVINQRLERRGDWVTPEYARKIAHRFVEPGAGVRKISNDGDEVVLQAEIGRVFGDE